MHSVNPKLAPLQAKLHLSKGTPPENCQNLQCNPILLTIDNPTIIDQEPEVAPRVYGLGIDVSGRDPLGWLALRLVTNSTLSYHWCHPSDGTLAHGKITLRE
jgi:hypothetical protein